MNSQSVMMFGRELELSISVRNELWQDLLHFPEGDELKKAGQALNDKDWAKVMKYFASTLYLDIQNDYGPGDVLSSLISLMSQKLDEKKYRQFLQSSWDIGAPSEVISRKFVDGVIAWEKLKSSREPDQSFSLAVAMTCELGVFLVEKMNESGLSTDKIKDNLKSVTGYLFSLSNLQNSCIRLSLIRYFGVLSAHGIDDYLLSRIMGRFGHSTLFQLLVLLEDKKNSSCAFSYLMENLPYYFLSAGPHQKMVHETFNNFMLKYPDIFAIFIKKVSKNFTKSESHISDICRKIFCTHLGALLRTASEINRKSLIWDLLCAIEDASDISVRNTYIKALSETQVCSGSLKSFLREISKGSCRAKHGSHITLARKSLGNKKTPKITLSLLKGAGAITQMSFLGSMENVA